MRSWGKSKMYYCPSSKKVWQLDKDNKPHVHYGMSSYGLERKTMQ